MSDEGPPAQLGEPSVSVPALRAALDRATAARELAESRMHASETRFQVLADALPLIVWTTNAEGCIEYGNPRWQSAVGFVAGSASERTVSELLHPEDRPRVLRTRKTAEHAEQPYEVEHRLRTRANGPYQWHIERGAPVRDAIGGRVLHWVFTAALATEAAYQLEESIRSERNKDDFIATLGHELRNPLAAISNGIEMIEAGRSEPLVVGRASQIMRRQLRQVMRIVEDLGDIYRIAHGSLELKKEWVDLAAVIATALDTAGPLIEARAHEVRTRLPESRLIVEADAARLAQVFANLLTNAAKYTEPGGWIALSAELKGDAAVVAVRDNGIGIAPAQAAVIFEPFARFAHGAAGGEGGLGIGLALARQLVELHAGTISVRSDGPGLGSEFIVRIPVARSEYGITR